LKQANQATERAAKELRDEIAALNSGGSPAIEKLRSEKAAVEEQLRIARDERSKLQRDINAIQQQAESSWATERMENALLRERINDIAAEVAKLAIQLEGPNSPIEAILAAEPAATSKTTRPANGTPSNSPTSNGTAASGSAPEGGGTLAERIRALQSHASRARQQQPG
jgi:predicted nuclease with TOPRIM domain